MAREEMTSSARPFLPFSRGGRRPIGVNLIQSHKIRVEGQVLSLWLCGGPADGMLTPSICPLTARNRVFAEPLGFRRHVVV